MEKTKYAVVNWKTEVKLFFYTLKDATEKYREYRYKGEAADVFNIEGNRWIRVEINLKLFS